MADKVEATGHEPIASIAVLTFVAPDGSEWIAGASMTRLRPKGAPLDSDTETVQLTRDGTPDWRLKEFRVVTPD